MNKKEWKQLAQERVERIIALERIIHQAFENERTLIKTCERAIEAAKLWEQIAQEGGENSWSLSTIRGAGSSTAKEGV